ncbi:chromosomal replication initiator protein DnaA [Acetobacter tropicalis]|uniref:Chromosomal replication initiator protein DnaA n=1 Tax=Acetobacter tropicalis TaxID=104102 RepID=A0A094YJ92_9PROT|nr:chromosomal replication initiator protein DnaA [Acetobacter tropicalis]KAA8389598.1 chromosomal replication initiator protein DnaA [Acetobacter tropicalis]KAA8390480.1 chromosomal replication initiator protein DnaA [Acetobacter tropicalis]KGB21407.1 Chromosomal replication initiator protein DnaA [Acetobacter tropicalis]KXV50626.1 chromosomal replication initiation protein [Acetobacter tropicalis]KXV55412.1 chromosomal replication initiation protein [Acetobacter tropicalis]
MTIGVDDDESAFSRMDDSKPVEESWLRICSKLKGEVGEVEYRTWLTKIALGPIDGDEITLLLPTRFLRDWVRSQYGDRLSELWNQEISSIRRVELQVARPGDPVAPPIMLDEPTTQAAPPPATGSIFEDTPRTAPEVKSDIVASLDTRFTFDTFVVGKPNEFAYACARRVAEKPSSVGFNPLFLYGGVGLGKTHLMHAIGAELLQRGNVSVAYMSAEKFMYRFIAAIRSQSTMEFKEQLRSVDVLMIDDLQFLIGKDNTQEEFFHTFNALVDAGRQIVVSADKSPSDLSGLEDRLRTRLGCGMVADIHATTFELRISILEAKAAASGVVVPAKVLEFLAHKITSNVRELEGALNRLIAHANLFGRPVTLEATQDVLHDILKAHDRRVTIEEIQKKVAEHWNIRLTDMSSARRARAVARPRQVAMYLAKQLTSRSLPEIGRKFGNRDHTTVMHAVSRVAELMERDAAFAEDVELLRRMLES